MEELDKEAKKDSRNEELGGLRRGEAIVRKG